MRALGQLLQKVLKCHDGAKLPTRRGANLFLATGCASVNRSVPDVGSDNCDGHRHPPTIP